MPAISASSAVRARCLSFPAVSERLSHGAPTFFIRERTSFVTLLMDGHHDLDFPHLVCAAPAGVQASLVASAPGTYFVPPYVGVRGWVGVRLDRKVPLAELAALCEEAYRTVAPRRLVELLEETGRSSRPRAEPVSSSRRASRGGASGPPRKGSPNRRRSG